MISARVTCALPLAITLTLLAALPARADVPPELAGRPIVAIEIEGAPLRADELGIPEGTPLTRRVVREAIARLLATGRWVDVQIDAEPRDGGAVLHVLLAPRIVLARIEIGGNSAIDDAAVRQTLRVREEGEVEAAGLSDLAELLRATYAERGYPRARVDVRLRDTDDASRKVLLVDVVEGEPMRLLGVSWDGDAPPEGDDAVSALGIGVGDVLDQRRLEEGVRAVQARLREHGWLESRVGAPALQPATGGAVLLLPLRIGRHYRVEIAGQAPLDREDVAAVLRLSEEPLTGVVVTTIHDRVLDLYRRHGYHGAEVEVTRTRDPERLGEPSAALLRVAIAPGDQLHVIGLSFPGASHFEGSFLRAQVTSYLEEDLPHPDVFYPVDSEVVDRVVGGRITGARRSVPADVEVIPDRIWYAPTYEEAIAHIQELYQAAGFLSAQVGPAELREIDADRSVVIVPVLEGPRTLVYDVRVRGNEALGARELLDASRLARGDAFGHLPLEEGRRRMLDLYAEHGHLFARVDPVVRFSPDRERAEIVFDVVERFPVYVGEIRIEGATSTVEGMIRDVLGLHPGDLYRPSAARDAEDRLLALGIFATASVAPQDPDLPERVKPLVVTVDERTTQVVGLSAGLSSGEGARGAFEYGYRNLLGLAIQLTLRVQLAYQFFFQDAELQAAIEPLSLLNRVERRITLGLAVPWIPGLPNVRGSLDLAHVRDNERDFGYDKDGVALTFTWQPERVVSFALSGEVEYNNVQLFGHLESLRELVEMAIANGDTRVQRLLRVPEGESAIGSTRLSFSLDLRDSPFNPTQGVSLGVTAEYARTIVADGDFLSDFIKLNATVNGYVPIAEGWVLALQGRFGNVFHLDSRSQVYPNRAFYLGGGDTLRGFLQDQVIPEDQAELIREGRIGASEIVRTGNIFYLVRAELRFPIVSDLYGGVFADVGNVWADAVFFDGTPRWNAGLGVRIATPIGPIALDYGFNLDRRLELNEPFGSFHFSIGLF